MAGADCTNWMVAWICCFISFVLLGVARLSGLLFVVVMDTYGVSRTEASLPFVLCYTVRNIAGPLIGFLGRSLGLIKVCVIGCISSAVGIGLCFFAENVLAITILWGGVFGLGLGLGTILIPEILRQYFIKDIAKANGIAFGGECIAGFVLPVLFEVSLKTYGTQGTFLILSGLVLNSIPAALLLRKPKQTNSAINYDGNSSEINSSYSNYSSSKQVDISKESSYTHRKSYVESKFHEEINPSNDVFESFLEKFKDDSKLSAKKHLPSQENQINEDLGLIGEKQPNRFATTSKRASFDVNSVSIQKKQLPCSRSLNHLYAEHSSSAIGTYYSCVQFETANSSRSEFKKAYSCDLKSFPNNPSVDTNLCDFDQEKRLTGSVRTKKSEHSAIKSFIVFTDLKFIFILLIQSTFIYVVTTTLTIIVDYSKDIGVADHEQIYIVMLMSIADMFGRFGLGFVTDSGIMTNTVFSSSSFAAMGILLLVSVWLNGFAFLMIVMFMFGLLLGGLLIVFPGIVSEQVEEDKITMALASRMSLYGPLSLTQSPLIGYFRGGLGSYKGVFYLLMTLCFICSILTLLTPLAAKRRDQRKGRCLRMLPYETDSLLKK